MRAAAIAAAGMVLSQPHSITIAVEAVAVHREFDRIGDPVARHQRGAHAGRAHRDAVGDGDGVEFDRGAAVGLDAAAHVLRQRRAA
jgi:hypothetical protein